MVYKIYPFKRSEKYRFYVRFDDKNGKQKNLSTGVTLPLKYTNKQRIEAEKKAEKVAEQKDRRFGLSRSRSLQHMFRQYIIPE